MIESTTNYEKAMFPQFHIFKVHSDGSRRWIKAATNLEDAKALVKMLCLANQLVPTFPQPFYCAVDA